MPPPVASGDFDEAKWRGLARGEQWLRIKWRHLRSETWEDATSDLSPSPPRRWRPSARFISRIDLRRMRPRRTPSSRKQAARLSHRRRRRRHRRRCPTDESVRRYHPLSPPSAAWHRSRRPGRTTNISASVSVDAAAGGGGGMRLRGAIAIPPPQRYIRRHPASRVPHRTPPLRTQVDDQPPSHRAQTWIGSGDPGAADAKAAVAQHLQEAAAERPPHRGFFMPGGRNVRLPTSASARAAGKRGRKGGRGGQWKFKERYFVAPAKIEAMDLNAPGDISIDEYKQYMANKVGRRGRARSPRREPRGGGQSRSRSRGTRTAVVPTAGKFHLVENGDGQPTKYSCTSSMSEMRRCSRAIKELQNDKARRRHPEAVASRTSALSRVRR